MPKIISFTLDLMDLWVSFVSFLQFIINFQLYRITLVIHLIMFKAFILSSFSRVFFLLLHLRWLTLCVRQCCLSFYKTMTSVWGVCVCLCSALKILYFHNFKIWLLCICEKKKIESPEVKFISRHKSTAHQEKNWFSLFLTDFVVVTILTTIEKKMSELKPSFISNEKEKKKQIFHLNFDMRWL